MLIIIFDLLLNEKINKCQVLVRLVLLVTSGSRELCCVLRMGERIVLCAGRKNCTNCIAYCEWGKQITLNIVSAPDNEWWMISPPAIATYQPTHPPTHHDHHRNRHQRQSRPKNSLAWYGPHPEMG